MRAAPYNLPKWCQMLVTGTPVTVEQAKEIIRRTDSLFIYGGTEEEEEAILHYLGIPCLLEDAPEETKRAWQRAWQREWGVLLLDEVPQNNWIASQDIDGPSGWCHPDGKIFYRGTIGPHGSLRQIYYDWSRIAETFPFLLVEATLLRGEEDTNPPLFSILLREGSAYLSYPGGEHIHNGRSLERRDTEEDIIISGSGEIGVPREWIEEWKERIASMSW